MMTTKRDVSKLIRTVFLMLVLTTFSTAMSASNAEWFEPVNLSGWMDELKTIHHLEMSDDQVATIRAFWVNMEPAVADLSDDEIRQLAHARHEHFLHNAPTTAAQAAGIILDGVREGRWRILVGDDAFTLDQAVRDDPEGAYEEAFFEKVMASGVFDQVSV